MLFVFPREIVNIIVIIIVRAVIFNIIIGFIFTVIVLVVGVSVWDSIKLFRHRTGGEGSVWVFVVMAYHGGLGGMGGNNAMVTVLGGWIKREGT